MRNTTNTMIGLLGGTFDPIHHGHLHIAKRVYDHIHCDDMIFIPCSQPAHRAQPSTTKEDRMNMLTLALQDFPQFDVDPCEMQREGPSLWIDTLKHLNSSNPQTHYCMIVGADAFNSMNTWHDWQHFFDYCHLIVVNRPHHPLSNQPWQKQLLLERGTDNKDDLKKSHHGHIYCLSIDPMDVSATSIRDRLNENIDIDIHCIPPQVYEYIVSNNLYGS